MKNYCVISHTHWDREWYLPFEQFRMRLVDLMDHLLEILRTDPGYRFHLDAQTIVLEDYLEIRKDRRAEIERYVKEGRLLIGPWYVQNDFHLTSGEATVRNLLIGTRIAESFGGSMPVGYAADQFGLCSQLPQILSRFGLDSCVFGRGFARGTSQFFWESEDGSRILCEHMFAWYNNAQRFPSDPAAALKLARMRADACFRMGKTEDALLMNGVDHLEAQEDLSQILRDVRPLLDPDERFFQDTLPEYVARLRKTVAEKKIDLPVYTGEFRDNGAPSVLTGTLAARSYLKTENVACQALLEKKFEPLYAALSLFGVCGYPDDYAEYLWKTLIQNHPHDSICGCSVDEVHRHMMDRFARVRENAEDLVSRGTAALLSHIDRKGLGKEQYLVAAVNPSQRRYRGVVTAQITIPRGEDRGAFTLSLGGKNVPFETLKIEKDISIRVLSPVNLPGNPTVNRYTVRFRADLPGMSYRTFVVTPVDGALAVAAPRRRAANRMENRYLRVQIGKDGTVTVTQKKTGRVYSGLLALEDNVDTGTAYQYPENDGAKIVTSHGGKAKVTRVEDTLLLQSRQISCQLPIRREEGSGRVDATFTLTLPAESETLEVAVRVRNACTHHRLRVLLPTGIRAEKNYAGQPFDVVTRDRVSRFVDDKTHPNTDFVGIDAGDGSHGFAVLQQGLYEYEHMEDGTLALTLLRAVDRIVDGFEQVSKVEEHWMTPEGECLGEYGFRFSLFPYEGDRETAEVAARASQALAAPYTAVDSVDPNKFIGGRPFVQAPGIPELYYRPIERQEVVLPPERTLFRTVKESVPGAMVLTACKGAEARDGSVILRFYNSTSKPVDLALSFFRPLAIAEETDLAERPVAPLAVSGGKTVVLSARPKQIVTLRVKTK